MTNKDIILDKICKELADTLKQKDDIEGTLNGVFRIDNEIYKIKINIEKFKETLNHIR